MNNNRNAILIVMRDPAKISSWVGEALHEYSNIHVSTAVTGLQGFVRFNEDLPALIIVEHDLPDLSGMSFSSIIKDMEKGSLSTIYVLGVTSLLQNAKADYYFPKEINKDLFAMQLRTFFDRQFMIAQHSDEIARAKMKQNEFLPAKLETNAFKVDTIYSPFGELSGDGVDYWYGEDKDGLYGLIFDCTGHDIVSFLQVGEIRALLKRGCRYFQLGMTSSLGDILKNVNEDLFALHGDDTICTAAVVFFFDFKKNMLHYCSAAMPSFHMRYKGESSMKEVLMENYPIGYEPDTDFEEKEISLEGVDEVIFSSDGFSELLLQNMDVGKIENAKHDDVSAILIQMKCAELMA